MNLMLMKLWVCRRCCDLDEDDEYVVVVDDVEDVDAV